MNNQQDIWKPYEGHILKISILPATTAGNVLEYAGKLVGSDATAIKLGPVTGAILSEIGSLEHALEDVSRTEAGIIGSNSTIFGKQTIQKASILINTDFVKWSADDGTLKAKPRKGTNLTVNLAAYVEMRDGGKLPDETHVRWYAFHNGKFLDACNLSYTLIEKASGLDLSPESPLRLIYRANKRV